MSIIFRPHRGGLADAMAERKEFETLEEMKQYIVEQHSDERGKPFGTEDIVTNDDTICNDVRIGWRDNRYVCIKRYGNKIYEIPQCIGMMATDYDADYWDKSEYNPKNR